MRPDRRIPLTAELGCLALLCCQPQIACRATADPGVIRYETARRFATSQQAVSFTSGDVTLVGTLVLPAGPGPHPALVVAHDAGPRTNADWAAQTRGLPALGVAVLRFDKRGCGKSTGDWRGAALTTLASDLVAGVQWLRRHPRVNRDEVGVWGGGQGWRVAALAAAQAGLDVAFAVLASGAPQAPWEQHQQRVRRDLRRDRADAMTVARVERVLNLAARYVSTGEGYRDLRHLASQPGFARAARYLVQGGVLPPEVHPDLLAWRQRRLNRPLAVVRRVRCPVLAVWGEADEQLDAPRAARLAERSFYDAGHLDYTGVVFPRADHQLRVGPAAPGSRRATPGQRFAPGVIEQLTEWLLRRVTLAPPP